MTTCAQTYICQEKTQSHQKLFLASLAIGNARKTSLMDRVRRCEGRSDWRGPSGNQIVLVCLKKTTWTWALRPDKVRQWRSMLEYEFHCFKCLLTVSSLRWQSSFTDSPPERTMETELTRGRRYETASLHSCSWKSNFASGEVNPSRLTCGAFTWPDFTIWSGTGTVGSELFKWTHVRREFLIRD